MNTQISIFPKIFYQKGSYPEKKKNTQISYIYTVSKPALYSFKNLIPKFNMLSKTSILYFENISEEMDILHFFYF